LTYYLNSQFFVFLDHYLVEIQEKDKNKQGIEDTSIRTCRYNGNRIRGVIRRINCGLLWTERRRQAFRACTNLTSIIIQNSVTEIGHSAFWGCTRLASVTFQGKIEPIIGDDPFDGDLWKKYLAEGIGIYTTTVPVDSDDSKWTKK
jgi:hypothetical protein